MTEVSSPTFQPSQHECVVPQMVFFTKTTIFSTSQTQDSQMALPAIPLWHTVQPSVTVRSLLPVHEGGTAYHLTFEHLHHHSTRLRNIW